MNGNVRPKGGGKWGEGGSGKTSVVRISRFFVFFWGIFFLWGQFLKTFSKTTFFHFFTITTTTRDENCPQIGRNPPIYIFITF